MTVPSNLNFYKIYNTLHDYKNGVSLQHAGMQQALEDAFKANKETAEQLARLIEASAAAVSTLEYASQALDAPKDSNFEQVITELKSAILTAKGY